LDQLLLSSTSFQGGPTQLTGGNDTPPDRDPSVNAALNEARNALREAPSEFEKLKALAAGAERLTILGDDCGR
jgi:hypothetical protein